MIDRTYLRPNQAESQNQKNWPHLAFWALLWLNLRWNSTYFVAEGHIYQLYLYGIFTFFVLYMLDTYKLTLFLYMNCYLTLDQYFLFDVLRLCLSFFNCQLLWMFFVMYPVQCVWNLSICPWSLCWINKL